jgi:hypothetical protein
MHAICIAYQRYIFSYLDIFSYLNIYFIKLVLFILLINQHKIKEVMRIQMKIILKIKTTFTNIFNITLVKVKFK